MILKTIRNVYKRHDVFRCVHQSHQHFASRVSVYHVLKQKGCFPKGCVFFRWRCRKLGKGSACRRGFKHVGKNCFSCRDFYDEKETNVPSTILSRGDYEQFVADLKGFEEWLLGVRGKEVNFTGQIHSVKPRFKRIEATHTRLYFDGFLITFKKGFINLDSIDDVVYGRVSSRLQGRVKLRQGDKVDFFGKVTLEQGRLVLQKIHRVFVEERTEDSYWDEGKARVAKRLGTFFSCQREQCFLCEKGSLVDVVDGGKEGPLIGRMMYCLEGVKDPSLCIHGVETDLPWDDCAHDAHGIAGNLFPPTR